MPAVFIPAQLREITDGKSMLIVSGATVADVIDAVEQQFPGFRARLIDGDQLNPNLQVSINDAISNRGLQAEVLPESEVHFLPLIGGG